MSDSQDDLSAVPMDKLAKVYRKMQAKIQELTTSYETEVEGIKAQQELVKNALKDQMLALGVKSVKTDQGTVSLSTKTRYNASDWDAFKEFVKEHDVLDLFEKRQIGGTASRLEVARARADYEQTAANVPDLQKSGLLS